jgi:hypothetical protein
LLFPRIGRQGALNSAATTDLYPDDCSLERPLESISNPKDVSTLLHERFLHGDPKSIHDYLRIFASELGERILQTYPALHGAHEVVSPRLVTLLRKAVSC